MHALKRKRATIAGEIQAGEKRLKALREALVHLDATLRLFDPDAEPGTIPPKRVHRKSNYFDGPELARLCNDTLRRA